MNVGRVRGGERVSEQDLTPQEIEDYEERLSILLECNPDNIAIRQQARREIIARRPKEPVQEALV